MYNSDRGTCRTSMTTTYDPHDPDYIDERSVRLELARVFDHCGECRRCVDLCGSFPALFEMLDGMDEADAGRMTPADQDTVVDACHRCSLCAIRCPYTPDLHDWAIDVPRLFQRANAMRTMTKSVSIRSRLTTQLTARRDLVGRLGSAVASIANRVVTAEPDASLRRVSSVVTGLSPQRLHSPFSKERFSTWFSRRPKITIGRPQGRVTMYPTCLVEYHEPSIGKDAVKVYEHNGIECDSSSAGCCGLPWLQAGDLDRFRSAAERNVEILAKEIRRGTDVVVLQPACGEVIRLSTAEHVDPERRGEAEFVARHTFDVAEYLMRVHEADDTVLETDFSGDVPAAITYHVPCHLRTQSSNLKSRDLLRLTGAVVRPIQQCSGVGDGWGRRSENEDASLAVVGRLAARLDATGDDVVVVAGDCQDANVAILEQTGRAVLHPIQVIARAYGFSETP